MVENKCDSKAAAVFVIGVVAGTLCIISSKALYECQARGSNGELQPFRPPVFETFIMFFGMLFALPLYFGLEGWKRWQARGNAAAQAKLAAEPTVTLKMVFSLGVPAVFDLSSVLLLMAGLMHVPASMWQLLRGSSIVFVALMKHFGLNSPLTPAMWVGVATIMLAVCLVGLSATVADDDGGRRRLASAGDKSESSEDTSDSAAGDLFFGILLTMGGTFMQSLQCACIYASDDGPHRPASCRLCTSYT